MAKFINTNKHRGYLNNINIDVKNRKSLIVPEILRGFQATLKNGDTINIKNNFSQNLQNLDESLAETEMDIFDEKKFWMNLIRPRKCDMNLFERIQSRVKTYDVSIAILSFILIFMSQLEYELNYYPNFYAYKQTPTPEKYQGLTYRIIYTIITFFLSKNITLIFSHIWALQLLLQLHHKT